ncbi:MAG: hypothetical protein IPN68_15945 [Bacteroidetes bacterium]|nr:hypothetical protein [Bacteroidota bacterium]
MTAIEENLDILVKVKYILIRQVNTLTIQFEEPVEKEIAVTLIDPQESR